MKIDLLELLKIANPAEIKTIMELAARYDAYRQKNSSFNKLIASIFKKKKKMPYE